MLSAERDGPDRGTQEQQLRRAILVGDVRDSRAEYPLGILLARRLINQLQHDAGVRYAWLRGKAVGNPLTSGGAGYADPVDDEEQARIEQQWKLAAATLARARCKRLVDQVCVYETMLSPHRLGHLVKGLAVLVKLGRR